MAVLEVDVWVVADHLRVPSAPAHLGRAEQQRAARMGPAELAAFLRSRALLRGVLAERLGCRPDEVELRAQCPDCGGGHGRLEVHVPRGRGPFVSLTRSSGAVAVAVSDAGPVGVDLESRRAVRPALAGVALSAAERRELDGVPGWRRGRVLARAWVRKEAVLKAVGTGLRTPPSHVEAAPCGHRHGFCATVAGVRVAQGADLALARRWAGAVAVVPAGLPPPAHGRAAPVGRGAAGPDACELPPLQVRVRHGFGAGIPLDQGTHPARWEAAPPAHR